MSVSQIYTDNYIFMSDYNGNYLVQPFEPENVNKSFEKIFGYNKKECLGKNIDSLISRNENYKELKSLTMNTLKEGVVNIEVVRFKKDKTPVNVLVRSVCIKINNEILGGYGIYTDITELKKYEKKLEDMSIYDSLTGLYNTNYFNNKLKELEKSGCDLIAFIMCDLNGLKFVNDTLGHQYGDTHLRNFADILKKSVRENDIDARIGGDEFTVILIDTNKNQVEKIIKRIKSNIEEFNRTLDNKMFNLSAAIGFSICENNEKSIEDVL